MKSMRVGLLSFPFSDGNLGCVALTCSIINVLRDLCGDDLQIIRLEQDDIPERITDFFKDVEFEFKKIKLKDFKRETIKAFKSCDIIIDVTFGDNFSDIYSEKFVLKTTLFKELVTISKTPLILAPQTYGPFSNSFLRMFAAHVIKKSKMVYSRDAVSTDFVKKISGINAMTVTDLAFALPKREVAVPKSDKMDIGIGISGLLWRGSFNNSSKFSTLKVDYVEYINKLIGYLVKSEKCNIHLIPHVIALEDSTIDGDWNECKEIHLKNDKTILAPKFADPMEAKGYISNMDIFIGARMHSTIAAFSTGVVTIPFAYSRKFQGLYDNLNYPYYVDGTVLDTQQAFEKTIKFINQKQVLRQAQKKSMDIIGDKLNEFKEDLKLQLDSCGGKENYGK